MEPSSSSKRTFIEYVSPPLNWVVKIHNHELCLNYLRNFEIWNRRPRTQKPHQDAVYGPNTYSTKGEELCKPFEEDPGMILETIQNIWSKYIIVALGQHISHKAAYTICQLVFSSTWLNEEVVDLFYASFFPLYLQREYSWQSLDLLKRAYAARPKNFMSLFIRHLVKNVKIPKKVLQDFIVNLKMEKRSDFMKAFMEITLSSEEFIHHLPLLNLLFLDSEKTPQMCENIASYLERYASDCYTNRDFGRLLLSLIKNMEGSDVNQRNIKEMIDSHGSEFKGPCQSYLDGLIGELIELQYGLIEQPRFVVQRPIEIYRTP